MRLRTVVSAGVVLTAALATLWTVRDGTIPPPPGEPVPLAQGTMQPLVQTSQGTDLAALRSCDHETPPGDTTGGCGVLDRVPNGSEVTMRCWRSTIAPSGYPSAKWFYVTTGKGSFNPGWSGWIYSDFVWPQTATPQCDNAILAAHPLPKVKPLVFTVVDGCTPDGKGELTARTANFTPGGTWEVYVSPYFSDQTGTVRGDGTFEWRIPCAGETSANGHEWSVKDVRTERNIFTPNGISIVKQTPVTQPKPTQTTPAPPTVTTTTGSSPRPPGTETAVPQPPTPQPPVPQPPANRVITVYNKVTNGPTEIREDKAAYLSTVTKNFCKRDGCALPSTDVATGARITAVCQTTGLRTTNGNDSDAGDNANPHLFESARWYGIAWPDGRFGYISEVWIDPTDRGGAGLRGC
ncbi:hypothetical protein ABZX92_32455 [Lentzea sp. NPDC006480]|uniref:hypothetical protein n=1 Tax=Lentzea sp. NPDC006480 TaxID=3157176 RepID=UPI0033B89162